MKTTIKKAMQLFLLLGMLLPAVPCLSASETGSLSTEIKDAVAASTPRIYVIGECDIVNSADGKTVGRILMPLSSGSGILIHKSERDAYVLTNAHVLVDDNSEVAKGIEVGDKTVSLVCKKSYNLAFFPNGVHDPRIYVAQEVVCKNLNQNTKQSIDTAVLRIPADGLPPALKIDTSVLNVSQPVVAVGYPGKLDRNTSFIEIAKEKNPLLTALERKLENFTYTGGYITVPFNVSDRDFVNPSITMGNISRYDETPGMPQRIIHSASIDSGNSGGPLIDPSTGYVVGMNTWGSVDIASSSIAQSAATITGFLNSNNIPYEVPEESGSGLIIAIVAGAVLLLLIIIIIVAVKASGNSKPGITLYAEGQTVALTMGQLKKGVLIGRSSSADVTLPQPTVSARHAHLFMRDNRLFIEDIGSKGGTKVNGNALQPHAPVPLHPGSTLMFTNIEVRVR